ncbi:MAG: hypothetical protein HXY37_06615 [Chloroflexi bacterium]|nr:hypothetical protein [Chloroflexota bacterium]
MTAVAAMLMTAIAVIGLVYRKEKKSFLVAWDALGIVAVYLLTTALLFQLRG